MSKNVINFPPLSDNPPSTLHRRRKDSRYQVFGGLGVHSVPEVGWLYFSAGLLGGVGWRRGEGDWEGWEDWEGVGLGEGMRE